MYFTRMYFNLLSFEINQIMNLFEYIYMNHNNPNIE